MNYGWTGKVLRVDLSTGAITTEDTSKYKDYLGGTGLGYKVLWDEVPPGTGAWDPENRLIFGVGPLTGSGAPCSGRVSITSLFPVHREELPGSGHMGGHWGPELKYAGYDSIIIQGKSEKPVWLRIEDDKVTLEDAYQIWGQGIYRATAYINNVMGAEAHVAAIGQAGENLVRLSCVICDRSHSAGGIGSVMGSKNLKAIGVRGTGSVKIAADKKTWKELNKYYLSLLGSNNQCVVAQTLQPWSEHSPAGTRWWAAPGRTWGAATPPIDTGTCPDVEHPTPDAPKPLNKIALRTHKGFGDFGQEGLRRTVRMNGCHSCPIRCHISTDVPELEKYGASRYNQNTCIGNSVLSALYYSTAPAGVADPQANPIILSQMSNYLADDYGFWSDYGGYSADFKWYSRTNIVADQFNPAEVPDPANPGLMIPNPNIGKPVLQKYLSPAEWTRFRTTKLWNTGKSPAELLEAGDPRFMQWIVAEICANKPGTLGYYMGMGPARLEALWPELAVAHNTISSLNSFKDGHVKHHSAETNNELGGIQSFFWNRDPQNHTHQNYYGNGLPEPLKQEIAQELVTNGQSLFNVADVAGEKAWDIRGTKTPMNQARAAFIAQCVVWLEIHNSSTQCNYTLPVWASPLKSRNYRGDPTLEAKVHEAVTGEPMSHKDLEKTGLRILTLFRVLTARYMEKANPGSGRDQRNKHDYANEWNYTNNYMSRVEVEVGKDLVYDQFGWDRTTGLPPAATLESLGLGFAIPTLRAEGLLPGEST